MSAAKRKKGHDRCKVRVQMTTQAQWVGFNAKKPLDIPHSALVTYEVLCNVVSDMLLYILGCSYVISPSPFAFNSCIWL